MYPVVRYYVFSNVFLPANLLPMRAAPCKADKSPDKNKSVSVKAFNDFLSFSLILSLKLQESLLQLMLTFVYG